MGGSMSERDDTLSPLSARSTQIDKEIDDLYNQINELKKEKNSLITKYMVENSRTIREMRNKWTDQIQ